MRIVVMLLFSLGLFIYDISNYRKMMDKSVDNKQAALEFYTKLKSVNKNAEPVLVGFRSMSEFLMCKHLVNPFTRLSHFSRGKDLLEGAITRDKNNPELLYFRLSTQSNAPALLKYNSNIEDDKNTLVKYVLENAAHPVADTVLYERIKKYLLQNKHCTVAEKAALKKL